MFPPKKQYPFDNGGVGIGITPGVSDPLIGKMPPNYAGPSNPNIGMTTGGGYQAPGNAVSNPGLQAPGVSMAFNPVTNNPNPTNAGPYVNPLNTPGREYWEPTAQERARFIQNNPGDEGRMREAFSRLIGSGGNTNSPGPPPISNNPGDIIPGSGPPPTNNIPPYANPSVVPQDANPGGGDTTNIPGPPPTNNPEIPIGNPPPTNNTPPPYVNPTPYVAGRETNWGSGSLDELRTYTGKSNWSDADTENIRKASGNLDWGKSMNTPQMAAQFAAHENKWDPNYIAPNYPHYSNSSAFIQPSTPNAQSQPQSAATQTLVDRYLGTRTRRPQYV